MQKQLQELTNSLVKLFTAHRKCVLQQSQACGLYVGQPQVLEYIRSHPGCTQNEIANALGVSPASIAFSTKRLQASGILMKQVNNLDMRRNRLYVTTDGIEALDKFENKFSELNERIFEGFSEEELKQLDNFSTRVTENLEKIMKEE